MQAWYHEAKRAVWKTPADVKAHYSSVSIVKGGRVVFNICGSKYRLVVKIVYAAGVVYIRFVGTHEEYDGIDVEVV